MFLTFKPRSTVCFVVLCVYQHFDDIATFDLAFSDSSQGSLV